MKHKDLNGNTDKLEERSTSRISKKHVLGLIVIMIIGAGFVYSSITKNADGKKSSKTENVDPQQFLINELLISSSFSGFPDFAYTSDKTHAGYLVSTRIPDTLEKIPCYCSCGAIGHKSLKDCFIKDTGEFADHASYCDICIEEALDVYGMQKEGLSIREIRSRIDERYSRYGEPTDTPLE